MDAREEVGHQNWGLAQQKKNKASNQQRQSDYTINYLGKSKRAINIHNIQVRRSSFSSSTEGYRLDEHTLKCASEPTLRTDYSRYRPKLKILSLFLFDQESTED